MRRRTFDSLVSWVGVRQLTAQKIYFPPKSNVAYTSLPASSQNAIAPYAGQQVTNGAQAQVYANDFIGVHLKEIGGGKTYSQLSSKLQLNPTNAALAAQVDALFKGMTLQGLLLTTYAFRQLGQIALIAGIVALVAALIMLILTILGFLHLRKTGPEAELRAGGPPQ